MTWFTVTLNIGLCRLDNINIQNNVFSHSPGDDMIWFTITLNIGLCRLDNINIELQRHKHKRKITIAVRWGKIWP
jgi:hypothetical protein